MNRFQMNFNNAGKLFKSVQIRGIVCLIFFTGCNGNAAPVNVNIAQQTLVSMMEGWKEGKTTEEMLDEKPPIVVQETDWDNGAKLLDYEIVTDDEPVGTNLVATVKLKLSNSDGKVAEKTATYIVGTSPGLTVYRNRMR